MNAYRQSLIGSHQQSWWFTIINEVTVVGQTGPERFTDLIVLTPFLIR
jgi:hypothetical protein